MPKDRHNSNEDFVKHWFVYIPFSWELLVLSGRYSFLYRQESIEILLKLKSYWNWNLIAMYNRITLVHCNKISITFHIIITILANFHMKLTNCFHLFTETFWEWVTTLSSLVGYTEDRSSITNIIRKKKSTQTNQLKA